MSHTGRHAAALFALLRFNTRAIDWFNPSVQAAWHSLALLVFIIPLRVFAAYVADTPFIEDAPSYLAIRSLQVTAALLLPLPLIWVFCHMQGLEQRFALYVTSSLWLALFWAVFAALMNGLTADVAFPVDVLKVVGTTLFFISYAYASYFAWAALRCNVFVAIGIATLAGMVMAASSDLLNLYLFGSARPHIGE